MIGHLFVADKSTSKHSISFFKCRLDCFFCLFFNYKVLSSKQPETVWAFVFKCAILSLFCLHKVNKLTNIVLCFKKKKRCFQTFESQTFSKVTCEHFKDK